MNTTASTFEFTSYKIQENRQDIVLKYAVVFEDGKRLEFEEVISLPKHIEALSEELKKVLDKTIHTLHLICGMSYWKTFCPSKISIKTQALTKDQSEFWNTVYTKGLGEFFYRNKIDFRNLISFPYSEVEVSESLEIDRGKKALMGIGGGKDSVVAYELLKKGSILTTAYMLETQKEYELINEVVESMAIDAIHIKRRIDPALFETNKLAGAFNGHIPITAIYSIVGLLSAVLYNFKYVVMSNEKSASYGNLNYLGEEINHQWSKSEEFEQLFQNYIQTNITPSIQYFSILRPWTEMRIVEEFVKFPKYFHTFSSCNNNFKVYKESLKNSRWCGKCPKCAFVFAMLSAYLPKNELLQIFNNNLFADDSLIDLYRELLGIKDYKPFECVGTPEEVQAAFFKSYSAKEYNEDINMKLFITEVLPGINNPEELLNAVRSKGNDSLIPEELRPLLT
ncbi:MAG: hypothetical protein ABIO02_03350 [Patescibacteria group bacterium]